MRKLVQRFAIASAPFVTASWRRRRVALVCAAGLTALAFPPHEASAASLEWSGYASAASDYIYRGISLLDSGLNLQGSVEVRADDTFVAGAWATNVDREWSYYSRVSNHLELNVYAGVDLGCGERCRARVIVTRYTYPGSEAGGWNEASASIAFAQRVGASLSYSPNAFGTGSSARTLEAWYVQPLSRRTSVEIDGGTMHLGANDYWFARAGVSHRVDRWVFDVSHYWSDPTYRRVHLDDRTERFVFSVSTAF